ncbi:hypothetical protein DFJ58DRAFT_847474 [Suillus subalutaceus]|uniref:uncharacterized protein n=1 Tax=Suillus subalutaceus TaxID=48586 RepID=UPI001B85F5CA|nr:uncharacterized protein DFJ58DRAFT_847474 [Suillus subalutaceus]KAG1835018.1 hypothetical protein DFJ58DRAFT_847474 [Suillus subalutaceus]
MTNCGHQGFQHKSYVYDPEFAGLTMLSGLPTFTIDIMGYLSLDPQPMLYPLYSPPASHETLKNHLSLVAYMVMPIEHFPERQDASLPLNLPWVRGKTGINEVMHRVYCHDSIACKHEAHTIIHHVEFPAGFYSSVPKVYFPNADDDNDIVTLLDIFGQGRSVADSSIAMFWKESTANTMSAGPSSVLGTMPADTQAWPKRTAAAVQLNIHKIMRACPKWRKALASDPSVIISCRTLAPDVQKGPRIMAGLSLAGAFVYSM